MNNYYPNYNNFTPNYYSSGVNNLNNNPYAQLIQQQIASSTLNGKVVDSQDVVKATEVPIGGYGVFPKADLSEIYIKSWNNNGTTNITTFKPEVSKIKEQTPVENPLDIISNKLSSLEEKIDSIVNEKAAEPVKKEEQLPQKQEKEFKF